MSLCTRCVALSLLLRRGALSARPTVRACPLTAASAAAAAVPARPSLSSYFRATLIHAPEWGAGVEILQDHLLGVDANSGRIAFVHPYSAGVEEQVAAEYALPTSGLTILPPTQFLIPGFIDTHCHAPQFQFAGTGTDRDLMVWLQTYTFPAEVRMGDPEFAKAVYARLVKAALAAGTTTAFYYGSSNTQPQRMREGRLQAGKRGKHARAAQLSLTGFSVCSYWVSLSHFCLSVASQARSTWKARKRWWINVFCRANAPSLAK